MKRKIFIIILINVFCFNIASYDVISNKCNSSTLRPIASEIAKKAIADDFAQKPDFTGQNPADYLVPNITDQEWRVVLERLGGPIFDISMEAILPELGVNALEGSKGGLGILEGDSGEGYAKAVGSYKVEGVKAFMVMPLYERKVVASTDLENMRQVIDTQDVVYEDIIDFESPVDSRIFVDPKKFDYPELLANPSKPIKVVVDEQGNHIKFNIVMYDSTKSIYRDFSASLFVISRGGTPVFQISCKDVEDVLYTDDQARRFEQQVLIGKAAPMLCKKLGIKPSILRLNEAHTVVAAAEMMQDPYFKDTAYVFTNHTPILAGLQIYYGKADWFARLNLPDVFIDKESGLEIKFKDIFIDENVDLNFSRAAMILSHLANGVSRAHGITLKDMFPGFTRKIRGILNGTGEFWKSDYLREAEIQESDVSAEKLWDIHKKDKQVLAELIKDRTGIDIDINMPTAVAIRRIDYYKQQHPMLKDIIRALCQDKGVRTKITIDDQEQEVEGLGMQIVVGGMVVNEDNADLQGWVKDFLGWMHDPSFKGRFIFISGNDLDLMRTVGAGCDAWIEMPRRNHQTGHQEEACGTSGMRAAENGNIPILSSGMWGDEFINTYNPATDEGNGFILQNITPKELYESLSIVSDLYYNWLDKSDLRFIRLRKRIYEQSKVLYIENMIKRYILEVFLPAQECMRAKKSIKKIGPITPDVDKSIECRVGDEIQISANLSLHDVSVVDSFKAEIWSNVNGHGSWEAVKMDNHKKLDADTFRFTGTVTATKAGGYGYKVRFVIKNNGEYFYTPKGLGSDGSISVSNKVSIIDRSKEKTSSAGLVLEGEPLSLSILAEKITKVIQAKKQESRPATIMFVGPQGSLKSTIIEKLTGLLQIKGFSVEIAEENAIQSLQLKERLNWREVFTFNFFIQKYPRADVVFFEMVTRKPSDTNNLDLFIRIKGGLSDNFDWSNLNIRQERIEKGTGSYEFAKIRTESPTSPDYSDRKADILIDTDFITFEMMDSGILEDLLKQGINTVLKDPFSIFATQDESTNSQPVNMQKDISVDKLISAAA